MTTMTCRVCDVIVPTGEYCGNCGAPASPRRGDGPSWLRASAYAAAPREHLLLPSVTTLFPSLPRRFRLAFGIALLGVIAVMVGTALPMWVASLIGIVGVGLPLLFVAYLVESDGVREVSVGVLAGTAVLSIALGYGWSLATDAAAEGVNDDALGLPVSTINLLLTCLAIPVGFLILLLAPAIILRVVRPGIRESLRGLTIGSFGAVCFASAFSLTALAPQLPNGPVDTDGSSPADLVIGGLIQGVAVPLTAVAVGGAVGAALWFVPRAGLERAWYSPTSPIPAVVFGLLAYVGLGLVDFFDLPNDVGTAVYAIVMVAALYGLRIVVHSVLLRGEPDPIEPGALVLCPECEHVVSDLPFCPRCGLAAQAASCTSRALRRSHRPVPTSS